jgi:hypothetical protein
MTALIISQRFRTARRRLIRLTAPEKCELTADWDRERLRCWPRLPRLNTAQGELLVAKAMCGVLGLAMAVISLVQP